MPFYQTGTVCVGAGVFGCVYDELVLLGVSGRVFVHMGWEVCAGEPGRGNFCRGVYFLFYVAF